MYTIYCIQGISIGIIDLPLLPLPLSIHINFFVMIPFLFVNTIKNGGGGEWGLGLDDLFFGYSLGVLIG